MISCHWHCYRQPIFLFKNGSFSWRMRSKWQMSMRRHKFLSIRTWGTHMSSFRLNLEFLKWSWEVELEKFNLPATPQILIHLYQLQLAFQNMAHLQYQNCRIQILQTFPLHIKIYCVESIRFSRNQALLYQLSKHKHNDYAAWVKVRRKKMQKIHFSFYPYCFNIFVDTSCARKMGGYLRSHRRSTSMCTKRLDGQHCRPRGLFVLKRSYTGSK